jgi:hypothetical protein
MKSKLIMIFIKCYIFIIIGFFLMKDIKENLIENIIEKISGLFDFLQK